MEPERVVSLAVQIGERIIRRIAVQQAQPAGDHQQHLAQAVNLSEDIIFHLIRLSF